MIDLTSALSESGSVSARRASMMFLRIQMAVAARLPKTTFISMIFSADQVEASTLSKPKVRDSSSDVFKSPTPTSENPKSFVNFQPVSFVTVVLCCSEMPFLVVIFFPYHFRCCYGRTPRSRKTPCAVWCRMGYSPPGF